ncbi:sec63 brl domain-containing protein [Hirsutella rhossiliensis]|uniref:Sec63 brl domain-containing protein n=1 Tax=Hirsutella rhossiliensis TaxID=111463 RepID=A0A9P8SER8_9HYPO|nr:sec63 brl domain-containing protein [Hirsutella rhossiliensis]KAH0958655.1 sec63 brl domain-containing protein [Hirsutella rhossiliensis]
MACQGNTTSSRPSQQLQLLPSRTPVTEQPPNNASDMHEIQLRHKLAAPTFKLLCGIPSSPDRREVLHRACLAAEFRSFPMKQAERGFFRHVNDHSPVPYPVRETVSEPWHKVFLLVQIDLHGAGWPNKVSADARKNLHQERGRIYVLLDHVLRCLVDILGRGRDGRGVNVALDVLRSVKAGVWEGSCNELLQVQGIGLAKMGRLAQAGIKSVKQLSRLDFFHIERLLSRNPPFGHQLLHQIAGFPLLTLQFDIVGQHLASSTSGPSGSNAAQKESLLIARIVLGHENEDKPLWRKKHPWTTLVIEGEGGKLLWFWRGSVKRLAGGKELVVGLDATRGEQLKVTFACEEVVGTIIRSTHLVSEDSFAMK